MTSFKLYSKDTSTFIGNMFAAVGLIIGGIVAGAVAYTTLVRDIRAADEKIENVESSSHENELRIDGVDVRLQSVERKQDMLIERVRQESSRQEEYRRRAEKTLDKILDKLD